ncbi:MAG: hypothetical protein ACR2RB_12980 [Gammaproteobacteria bacterium]
MRRIRSKWRNKGRAVALEDNAVALGAVVWRIALNAAKNLHAEDFVYDDDAQRVGVIQEYLAFLVHLADRLAHGQMAQEQRERFISSLGLDVARRLHQNQLEIMGTGDHREQFVAVLNARADEYAGTQFTAQGPGYQALRAFGHNVQRVMGHGQTNRWAIDQVMEIDAPEAVTQIRQAMANLLRTSKTV